jgi:hypothetical protein
MLLLAAVSEVIERIVLLGNPVLRSLWAARHLALQLTSQRWPPLSGGIRELSEHDPSVLIDYIVKGIHNPPYKKFLA